MKCPICGRGEVTHVGPWDVGGSGTFGLGFNMADGNTCCSLHHKFFGTRDEAQELADSRSLEQWAVDEDTSWQNEQEDLIGEQDPYDTEFMQW